MASMSEKLELNEMISDEQIMELITAKREGKCIMYNNDYDKMQYQVEKNHIWDFRKNVYVICGN